MTKRDDLIAHLTESQQPVQADDPMSEAGRKVLLAELLKMLNNEEGSRAGEDALPIHDMRVAIRRMRSILNLLEPYYKQKAITPYVRELRKVARKLGAVRDLDVLIEDVEKYAAENESISAALDPVIAHLQAKRAPDLERLNVVLSRSAYRRFVKDYADFLTTPEKGARSTDNDLAPVQVRHILPEMTYHALGAVRAYDGVIEEANITTLHALRIEFKQLRYIISLFQGVLGNSVGEFIEELKAIQDHLGRLCDIDIARDNLNDLMSEFDPETEAEAQAALQAYIDALETEMNTLREGVTDVWKRFNTKKVQRMLATAVANI